MVNDYPQEKIREIILEEMNDSPVIITLKTDCSNLKTEVRRQGVLLEDLSSKLDAVLEVTINSAKIMNRLDSHEGRIAAVEAAERLLSLSS